MTDKDTLLVHLEYIRDKVDETAEDVKKMSHTLVEHGVRIGSVERKVETAVIVKAAEAPRRPWIGLGSFIGGFLAGVTGGKIGSGS